MNKKILIIIIIALSAGVAFYSLRGMITPYVSFDEAMESGSYVQIIGKFDRGGKMSHEKDYFRFHLTDEKNTSMAIHYKGIKPANFEHADQIVVLGVYDKNSQAFDADKVLVKCPSKYKKAD
ncbi:MAG: cytochrome c maturation protein CcmE [Spirochaetes bacterium]|nr:cytochrome c maturation protein CcmE [Spirochaetota bacterium]